MPTLLVIISLVLLFLVYFLVLGFIFFILASHIWSDISGAPFVRNKDKAILETLKLAKLDANDILLDLGSGDGKVLVKAIETFHIKRGIGYEVSAWPYWISVCKRMFSRNAELKSKLKLYNKSFFKADLGEATVIYVYLLPKLLEKVEPLLIKMKQKNPNLKIISAVFGFKNLKAKETSKIYHETFNSYQKLFLY